MISRTVLYDMRLDDLKHDPWGTAMNHAFGLCETLTDQGCYADIPAGLGYSPAWGGVDREDYQFQAYTESLEDGTFTVGDYVRALLILDRYLEIVKLAGGDY